MLASGLGQEPAQGEGMVFARGTRAGQVDNRSILLSDPEGGVHLGRFRSKRRPFEGAPRRACYGRGSAKGGSRTWVLADGTAHPVARRGGFFVNCAQFKHVARTTKQRTPCARGRRLPLVPKSILGFFVNCAQFKLIVRTNHHVALPFLGTSS